VSVHINYWGDTGNNMFQYSFARIVSESLGYKMYGECRNLNDFKRNCVDLYVDDDDRYKYIDIR